MGMPPDVVNAGDALPPPAGGRAHRGAERLALAHGLSERPTAFFQTLEAASLLEELAGDPCPQVRQAVAIALERLPEPLYAALHPRLARDDNSFVLNAVRRAAARRERAARVARRTRFGVDQIAAHLQRIEKKHGAAAAREASRLCDRYTQLLVASMVHDLRGVLTHLKANTLTLLAESAATVGARRARLPARVRDDLEFLERTVLDMEQFTSPLETACRPERLVDLVRASLEIAAASVRANAEIDPAAVAVELDVPAALCVSVARHQIVTAFANVLKNAFEAFIGGWPRRTLGSVGAAGGEMSAQANAVEADHCRVVISARRHHREVVLVIRDNGMGFAQEEADALHLCTPGRRNKTKRNSTGYGLPNAARKIMAQGGSIQFDSQEGRGATVTVRLPAAAEGQ